MVVSCLMCGTVQWYGAMDITVTYCGEMSQKSENLVRKSLKEVSLNTYYYALRLEIKIVAEIIYDIMTGSSLSLIFLQTHIMSIDTKITLKSSTKTAVFGVCVSKWNAMMTVSLGVLWFHFNLNFKVLLQDSRFDGSMHSIQNNAIWASESSQHSILGT